MDVNTELRTHGHKGLTARCRNGQTDGGEGMRRKLKKEEAVRLSYDVFIFYSFRHHMFVFI